jgi:hypothetical protein
MDTRYTHTLGRLVRDAALSLCLEDDLTQELQKGLQERNWLIHHFYREYAPAAFDSELRRRAISKIKSIRANLEILYRTLLQGILP